MLEQMRNAIQVVSAVAEIPRRQAEKIAKDLASKAGLGSSQISDLASDIMQKSRENAQMVASLVGSEVRRQVKALGLVTRDDLERVNRRIQGLASKQEVEAMLARSKFRPTAKPKNPKKVDLNR